MRTIKDKVFKFYTDPGHGWLAVKLTDLSLLNVDFSTISKYSYAKGHTAYLEEDCDANIFLSKFKEVYSQEPKIVVKHTDKNSPIRNYERFA